jgi:two-component system phosphate regulon response regulator OmpR
MPGRNGLEALRDIRVDSPVPVIMLTAKGDETDRIVGLEMGADDYLPKPFNPRELLARINAVLRRGDAVHTARQVKEDDHKIDVGGITLNKARRTVQVGGKDLELSTTEYKVLKVLMENPNTVLNRDQLMDLAMGKDFLAFDRSIDVHISKLRSKLGENPKKPKLIRTVWGTGYMFVDEP